MKTEERNEAQVLRHLGLYEFTDIYLRPTLHL